MRTFFVLICSLALGLATVDGQGQQTGKEKKKTASAPKTATPQHGTAAVKPAHTAHAAPMIKPTGQAKPAGPPTHIAKSPEAGKAKKGTSAATTSGKPAQVNNAQAEANKAKHNAEVNKAQQQAEINKAKAHGKAAGANQAAAAGQPAGAFKPGAGKPGKAGIAAGHPVKPKHFNVPKQPNTAKAPPVKFQQGRRIEGSQNWQGRQYNVFRNYQAQWHDRGWWHSHYHNNIVFVFGAPYYFNSGYWFPAWGYSPNAYYAWDGPVYAYNRLPPDQVTANVQSSLQQQGYYHGEVDGLLGPLTRSAIADYQRDRGLYITSAIDQPTLESLGMT
jgi:putative peptidoglycan binding protein